MSRVVHTNPSHNLESHPVYLRLLMIHLTSRRGSQDKLRMKSWNSITSYRYRMPSIAAVNLHQNPLSLNIKREVGVTWRTSLTNSIPRINSNPRTNSIPRFLRSRHLRLGQHQRKQLWSQLIMVLRLSLWNSSSSILS